MWRKAGFSVGLLLLAGSPVSGQDWARKMFQHTEHDFGHLARGAKAEFEFVVSNIYLEDVHIAGVRSSCGCTSPRIKKALLKTYESGAIVAAFNTRSFRGRKGATITVTFDRPLHAEVQLHVAGYVRGDVMVRPGSVQLGSVERGTPTDARLAVDYAGRTGWKILEVKSSNPHIAAKAVPRSRGGRRVSYQLLVHLDGSAPVGYLNDHLTLVTNDRRSPQIGVRVEGRVTSAVTVSPASLFLGVVPPGKKVTKKLVVRSKRPFRILSITCANASFEFDTPRDGAPKPLHVVPVTFVAGSSPGKVSETIRIETDLRQPAPQLAAYAVVSSP